MNAFCSLNKEYVGIFITLTSIKIYSINHSVKVKYIWRNMSQKRTLTYTTYKCVNRLEAMVLHASRLSTGYQNSYSVPHKSRFQPVWARDNTRCPGYCALNGIAEHTLAQCEIARIAPCRKEMAYSLRKRERKDYKESAGIQLPRASRPRLRRPEAELFDVDIVATEEGTGRVKVHYRGWGEEFDEWKDQEDLVDIEPDVPAAGEY